MKVLIIIIILTIVLTALTLSSMTDDKNKALKAIADKYGKDIAKTVEQMFRLETNHFKSLAYVRTKGAGMQATKNEFPYGWTSFTSLWKDENLRPTGLTTLNDNQTSQPIQFIIFPSVEAGMTAVADYLTRHRAGNWNGTETARMEEYERRLNTIVPRITNTFA